MAFSMQDPEALKRYIARTAELLKAASDEGAQRLLRGMLRDAEERLAKIQRRLMTAS